MEHRLLAKRDLKDFVAHLQREFKVAGVRPKENKFIFTILEEGEVPLLDYVTTLLPPKKFFLPTRETLFRFKEGEVNAVEEAPPLIIFGVHNCDLTSFRLLDQALTRENPDSYYQKRRQNTLIFGVDCMPDKYCFCQSTGADKVNGGFDLYFTDIGEFYVIALGTEKGAEVIKKHAKTDSVRAEFLKKKEVLAEQKSGSFTARLTMTVPALARLLGETWDSRVWQEIGDICVSCGACNFTCPTCYCFDVADETTLDISEGERYRRWDGCTLADFARVASGENFRPNRAARLRHRFGRKGRYLWEMFGELGCVGCGRCGRSCIVDIIAHEVFNRLEAYHKLESYNIQRVRK